MKTLFQRSFGDQSRRNLLGDAFPSLAPNLEKESWFWFSLVVYRSPKVLKWIRLTTVKPLLSGPPIKRTLSWVPTLTSYIFLYNEPLFSGHFYILSGRGHLISIVFGQFLLLKPLLSGHRTELTTVRSIGSVGLRPWNTCCSRLMFLHLQTN